MLLAVIAGCEVLFWVLLLGGLLMRYVLRQRRVSTVLLLLVPVADLVLVVATIVDLARGATADWTHTLAASYLGFSVGFGPSIMTSMDRRFAHRFAGGPKPEKPPKYGQEKTRYEWQLFGHAAVAIGIALAFLFGAIIIIHDPMRTMAFKPQIISLISIFGIWLAFPVSYTIWPARPRESRKKAGRANP
jgi:hypothetical protein